MPIDKDVLRSAIKEIGLDENDEKVREKMRKGLYDVVKQYSDLLERTAKAIASGNKHNMEDINNALQNEFMLLGCKLEWSDNQPEDNQASLFFEDGKLILRRRPSMAIADENTLREYAHELGALALMLKQTQTEKRNLVDIELEKEEMSITDTLASSHIIDSILLTLIRQKRAKF